MVGVFGFLFKSFQKLSGLKDTNVYESFLLCGKYDHHGSPRGHYGSSVFKIDIDRHNSEKHEAYNL